MKTVKCRKMLIISIKKYAIFALICAIVAVVFFSPMMIASVAIVHADCKTVVIDAGHGGKDAGVSGTKTGVKESDLNLQIALLLGEYLQSGGYSVVYTRKNDTSLSFFPSTGSRKRDDFFRRGEIVNNARADVVVSIHMNAYQALPTRRGAQVFFAKGRQSSKAFAIVVQDKLNQAINLDGSGREFAPLSAEKYLLECSPSPSVIVECGFLSNAIDEQNLQNANYQSKLAYAIFEGIAIYLSNDEG